MSDSVWPQRWQPTRLPRPWDSPGKNTGVGCCFLLQCMKVKSASELAQSCLTRSDPMDCSLSGSSVHGIFQARVLEWGAIAFSDILEKQYFIISSLIQIFIEHKYKIPGWTAQKLVHLKKCFIINIKLFKWIFFLYSISESWNWFIKKFLTLKNGQDGKFHVICILYILSIFIKN